MTTLIDRIMKKMFDAYEKDYYLNGNIFYNIGYKHWLYGTVYLNGFIRRLSQAKKELKQYKQSDLNKGEIIYIDN